MKRLLHKLNKNLLLKVAGFNSIYVIIKILIGAVMSKILALYVGAAGLAVLANFRDFAQGAFTFSVLGLDNGLVKNAAQFKNDSHQLKQVFNTAWVLGLISSILVGLLCYLGAGWLDYKLLNVGVSFELVFKVLGLSLPFHVFFVMLSSLMQGFEWYKKYIILNIVISIVLFGISGFLAFEYNLQGALYSIVIVPLLQCLVILIFWFFGRKKNNIVLSSLFSYKLNKQKALSLFKYSAMALISATIIPFSYIVIRKWVMQDVSDEAAGWWVAVTRVSAYYMMFVTSLISLYVLPSLSKDDSIKNYRSTALHFFKNILPLVILGLIAVFLCRELLVDVLFTEEFYGAVPLFKWQLAGDFIKVITTVLAFRFIAQNDLKKYLIAEVLSVASFMSFSYWLIPKYQEEGVVIAYFLNYVFYFFLIISLLRKELFTKTIVN